ncbi:MAG: ribonuclease P protein component [Clostridium sp.]|nr:ribonuclease P protein component [Clostridium sp.]
MKDNTLRENKDFRRLYYRGKKQISPCLVTYVMRNNLGEMRIGITSGKKIGNAVKRNRARRLIRTAFFNCRGRINGSYDIVFVARTKTCYMKMQEVQAQMELQLKELGVFD